MDEAEKVHDIFCKKVMGVPLASTNGAPITCVKDLGKANKKIRVLNTVIKCWLQMSETDNTNPSRDIQG
jgi:hypothetical protein